MLEIIKQLLQSWAVAWLNSKIRKLENKLDKAHTKLQKKISPEQQTEYDDDY